VFVTSSTYGTGGVVASRRRPPPRCVCGSNHRVVGPLRIRGEGCHPSRASDADAGRRTPSGIFRDHARNMPPAGTEIARRTASTRQPGKPAPRA
jgi:hypothetical protein